MRERQFDSGREKKGTEIVVHPKVKIVDQKICKKVLRPGLFWDLNLKFISSSLHFEKKNAELK